MAWTANIEGSSPFSRFFPFNQAVCGDCEGPEPRRYAGAAAGGNYASLMAAMLANWNSALQYLHPHISHPDTPSSLHLYGTSLQAADDVEIPAADLPAGLPAWMRSLENWADRTGTTSDTKRATITITVPADARPWH